MLIKPVIEQNFVEIVEPQEVVEDDVVTAVANRLLKTSDDNKGKEARVLAQISLDNNGLSVEQTAGQIARMSQNSRDDSIKLNCLKLALEIHEVLVDNGDKDGNAQIQIVISGNDDLKVSGLDLNSMLNPGR